MDTWILLYIGLLGLGYIFSPAKGHPPFPNVGQKRFQTYAYIYIYIYIYIFAYVCPTVGLVECGVSTARMRSAKTNCKGQGVPHSCHRFFSRSSSPRCAHAQLQAGEVGPSSVFREYEHGCSWNSGAGTMTCVCSKDWLCDYKKTLLGSVITI